jgi:hypothetical protein
MMSGAETDIAAVDAVLAELGGAGGVLATSLLGRALRRLSLAPSLGQLRQWADDYASGAGAPGSAGAHASSTISRTALHSIAQECYVAPTDQRADFLACLRMFDRYGDGRVRVAELRAALQHDGEPMPVAEIDAAMALLAPSVVMEEGEPCIRPDRAAALLFPSLGTTPAVSVSGVGGGDTWEGLTHAQHSGNTWEHELATVVRERDDGGVRSYLEHLSDAELQDVLVWVALHAGDPRLPGGMAARYSQIIDEMLRGQQPGMVGQSSIGGQGGGGGGGGELALEAAPYAEDERGLPMMPRPPAHGGGGGGRYVDAGAGLSATARETHLAAARLAARGAVASAEQLASLASLQRAVIRRYGFRGGVYGRAPADFSSAVAIMSAQLQRFGFLLRNGLEVVKFPRQGKPRTRVLWLHGDGSLRLGTLREMAASRADARAAESSEGHGERIIPLNDLERVIDGATTAAFLNSPAYKGEVVGSEECCLTLVGKPVQPQYNIKLPTKKGMRLFSAKFNAMIAMLRGPEGRPWGPRARQVSARYFAKHGHAPSDKLLLAVAEAPTLTAEQVAALAPTARALHEAEQANVLIGKVDARALHEAALATAVVDKVHR